MKDQDLLIRGLKDEGRAAVEWASSPTARAQFRAAMGVARQLGSAVTGTELSAMLWAAHNAKPIAEASDGKTRQKRELRFRPEGTDDGELPVSFTMEAFDSPQQKIRGTWKDTSPAVRTMLAEHISRRELQGLLTEGIDWLAWDGSLG